MQSHHIDLVTKLIKQLNEYKSEQLDPLIIQSITELRESDHLILQLIKQLREPSQSNHLISQFIKHIHRSKQPHDFLLKLSKQIKQLNYNENYDYWEKFNSKTDKDSVEIKLNGEIKAAKSFTHLFFAEYKLTDFLNQDCKRILQLGASTGNFLEQYKENNWDVIGYDYSKKSIEKMQIKHISSRLIDLNSTDLICSQLRLTYQDQLQADLIKPTNILAIRVMQYLSPSALQLLIFNLINLSSPSTTFFIVGSINTEKSCKKDDRRTQNYIASFFGARTDMECIYNALTNDVNKNRKKITSKNDDVDQMLVIRKRG